jgi:hypothetical protein
MLYKHVQVSFSVLVSAPVPANAFSVTRRRPAFLVVVAPSETLHVAVQFSAALLFETCTGDRLCRTTYSTLFLLKSDVPEERRKERFISERRGGSFIHRFGEEQTE